MKNSILLFFLLLVWGCQSHATKHENYISTANPAVASKDSLVEHDDSTTCTTTGELIDTFEQNNTLFEHFKNGDKYLEWLKVTTKDGKCTALKLEPEEGSHCNGEFEFEDWDEDGFKDQIKHHCYSEVDDEIESAAKLFYLELKN